MPDLAPADIARDAMKAMLNDETLRTFVKDIAGAAVAEAMKDSQARGRELQENPRHMLAALLGDKTARPGLPPAAEDERGLTLAAVARSILVGRGDPAGAKRAADAIYKGSPMLERVRMALDSGEPTASGMTFKALSSNVFASGGALAPGAFVNELIELLRPRTAFRAALPTIIPLDRGTATVPRVSGGATASYIGEGTTIQATEQTTDSITLMARKLAALVPVNSELLQYASSDVDRMVRDDLIGAIGQKEDMTFLTGDGVSNTPRGLRYWVADANVSTAAVTNTAAGAAAWAVLMLGLLAANYARMLRPSWFFSTTQRFGFMNHVFVNGPWAFRDEILGGTFYGIPYQLVNDVAFPTAAGGTKNAALADMADVLLGQASTVTIEASNTAAYTNSAGTLVSAFSQDQTVIRVIEQHDVGCRHRGSLAWATNAAFS